MKNIYTLTICILSSSFTRIIILSFICILLPGGLQKTVIASDMTQSIYSTTKSHTNAPVFTIDKETNTKRFSKSNNINENIPVPGKSTPLPIQGVNQQQHSEEDHHEHLHDTAEEHHITITFPLLMRIAIILLFIVCLL